MQSWLDIIGSFVIAGTITVMVISFNAQMQANAEEIFKSAYGQQSARTTAEILETDFYKMGNRVTGSKLILADSNRISFNSDIDNNTVVDSISYYLGTAASINRTYEKPLYRKVNSSAPQMVALVTEVKFTYLDSMSVEMLPITLLLQPMRDRVKAVRVRLITRSPENTGDTLYQSTEWTKLIRPKNL